MSLRWISAFGFGALALVVGWPVPASAQEVLKIDERFACAAEPGSISEEAALFRSTEAASRILREIVDYVGLSAERIDLRASDVANAIAYLDPLSRRRLILYNEDFVRRLQSESGSAWVPLAILAHELAHHLNNHLEIAEADRRRVEELEADRFAGHVLFKMGADLEAVTAVFEELGEGGDYPPRSARKAAATNGWWIAKEQGGYPGTGSPLEVPEDTRPGPGATDRPPGLGVPAQVPVQPMDSPVQPVEGLALRVVQVPFVPHTGGLSGGPGVSFFVVGMARAPRGSQLQIVITFSFADGRGILFPHPQEYHYRGMGNLLATGSERTMMSGDLMDLATIPVNPIPHYSLNLVPTGYQNSYPIAAAVHVLINDVVVATAPPVNFTVQW